MNISLNLLKPFNSFIIHKLPTEDEEYKCKHNKSSNNDGS